MCNEKPKKNTKCAKLQQPEEDVATKRLRTRSTFRQSLMASVGESQVVEKTPVYILVDHGIKVIEGCCRNVMLL